MNCCGEPTFTVPLHRSSSPADSTSFSPPIVAGAKPTSSHCSTGATPNALAEPGAASCSGDAGSTSLSKPVCSAIISTPRTTSTASEPRSTVQLATHLDGVALYSEINPLTWAADFTTTAPEPQRVEWINQVTWMLDRLDADARQQQWNRWMRDYWARRLDSIPLRLTTEEASALAGWVVHLDDSIADAVDLAVATAAGLEQHGDILRDLKKHVQRAPAECVRFLAHLLAGTKPPSWGCHYLPGIMLQLRGQADEHDIRRIREESLRLGCRGAAEW